MILQLQLAFNKADEDRNNLAILKRYLKDQLEGLAAYKELTDELEALNLKKKQIIASVLENNKKEVDEIDKLTLNLKSQKQMVSDVALKDYLAGKNIELVKPNGNILEPVFSVKFRKTGENRKLTAEEKEIFGQTSVLRERLDLE